MGLRADSQDVRYVSASETVSTRQPSALLRSSVIALIGGALTVAAVIVPDALLDRQAAERFTTAANVAATPVLDAATKQFQQLQQLAAASVTGATSDSFSEVLQQQTWATDSLFGEVAYVEYLNQDSVMEAGVESVMDGDTTQVTASTNGDPLLVVRSFTSGGSQNLLFGSDTAQFLADIGIAGRPEPSVEPKLVWAPASTMIRAGIVAPARSASTIPPGEQSIDNTDSFVQEQPAQDQPAQEQPAEEQQVQTPQTQPVDVTDPLEDGDTTDGANLASTSRTVIALAIPVSGRGWIVATVVPVNEAPNGLARIVEIGDENAKKTIGGLGIEQTARRTRTLQYDRTFGRVKLDISILGPWRFGTPRRTHPLRDGLGIGGLTLGLAALVGMRQHRRNVAALTRMVSQARDQARLDSLTGLANRVGMLDAMTSTTPEDGVAVLLADLDRFKNVNDSRGHASGDLLLQAVAERFRTMAAEHSSVRCVARFGGDEFVVILSGNPDTLPTDAVSFADAILMQLKTPFPLGGDTVVIGASIGLALGTGADTESLLGDADIAMYAAKRAGGSRVAVANDELRKAGSGQLDLEIGIRNALAHGEFVPYFQPIVNEEGHLHSFEALIRWRRPDGELMSPGAFLPAAQTAGLLAEVSTSVLASVCPYVAEWNTARVRKGMEPLTVHVNCVEGQLMDFGFPDVVASLLSHHGVDPSWIMLEVSEETALDKIARGTPTLQSLRSIGIRFSLDDFGFGNSSLTMLRELGEVAELKLDKSIVDDIANAGIGGDADVVDAILGFARRRNITIVAEGVEQIAQWEALKVLGVQLYQGFLFARPLPPDIAALWAAGERQADVVWQPNADLSVGV